MFIHEHGVRLNMHSGPSAIPLPVLILIPLVVFAEIFIIFPVISRVSGWNVLAQRFRYDGPWNGHLWKYRSARFRAFTNYNGCLNVGAGEHGLYLKPIWIVSYCHPPLLIPWHEITYRTEHSFFGEVTILTLGSQEQVPCRVYRQLAVDLAAAATTHSCLQTP